MSQVDPLCSSLFVPSVEFPVVSLQHGPMKFVPSEVSSAASSEIHPSPYFQLKPGFEWVAAVLLITMLLPLIGAIWMLIALCNGRPVFYRQLRVGKNERRFEIWKFRTMRCDAEKESGPVWSTSNDGRVTWLGRWLRATHLDEIPQLFNVLLGDMNIIGPRPERPEFVSELVRDIPNYSLRHVVRPGITGLAQVKQGYDTCVKDVTRKVSLDLRYIESASLYQDVSILVLTIPYVFKEVTAAVATRLTWLLPKRNGTKDRNVIASEPISLLKQIHQQPETSLEEQICDEIFQQRQMLLNIQHEPSHSIPRPHMTEPGQQSNSREKVENSKARR